jgi:hypothetical protein
MSLSLSEENKHFSFKVNVKTDQINDRIIVKGRIDNKEDFYKLVLNEYFKWHMSPIHELKTDDHDFNELKRNEKNGKEIIVNESYFSVFKRIVEPKIFQAVANQYKKLMSPFITELSTSWTFDKNGFDVDVFTPYQAIKTNEGRGFLLHNYSFISDILVLVTIEKCGSLKFEDPNEDIYIGIQNKDDFVLNRDIIDSRYSTAYVSNGCYYNNTLGGNGMKEISVIRKKEKIMHGVSAKELENYRKNMTSLVESQDNVDDFIDLMNAEDKKEKKNIKEETYNNKFGVGDTIIIGFARNTKLFIFGKVGGCVSVTKHAYIGAFKICVQTLTANNFKVKIDLINKDYSSNKLLEQSINNIKKILNENYPNERKFIDSVIDETTHIEKIRNLTLKMMIPIIEFGIINERHVWDQYEVFKFGKCRIMFPTYTSVKLFQAKINQNRMSTYIRTVATINSGIHFFEVEVLEGCNDFRSFVGVIDSKFDIDKGKGNYWCLNNNGCVYYCINGKDRLNKHFIPDVTYKVGDKIGVFLDMETGKVDFFYNGINISSFAFDIKGTVQFFVSLSSVGQSYNILPSDLSTYFYYMSGNMVEQDEFCEVYSSGCIFVDSDRVIINSDIAILVSKKQLKSGRRYHEFVITNPQVSKGTIGFDSKYNFEITQDDLDALDKLDGDGNGDDKKIRIGALIDFDNYIIEIYKNREKISTHQPEMINPPVKFSALINTDNFFKLAANDPILGVELSQDCEKEMREILFLYQ